MKLIRVDVSKAALAWPLFATWNACVFSGTQRGRVAKISAFLTFLPVLVTTTLFWAAIWTAFIWLVSLLATFPVLLMVVGLG
jgi:hypothetical protein